MTNAVERDLSAEIRIQREYYARSANQYDSMHVDGSIEHNFALQFMIGVVRYLGVRSILDIGSGTGRALVKIKSELLVASKSSA